MIPLLNHYASLPILIIPTIYCYFYNFDMLLPTFYMFSLLRAYLTKKREDRPYDYSVNMSHDGKESFGHQL